MGKISFEQQHDSHVISLTFSSLFLFQEELFSTQTHSIMLYKKLHKMKTKLSSSLCSTA